MNSTDQPKNYGIPFAQNGIKNTIPKEKNSSQKANEASYDTGFPEITMELISAGGEPPLGQDTNGILYDISNAVRWNSAGGYFNFDQVFSTQIGGYPKGALLWSADKTFFYLSLVDNNTQNPETANPLNQWRIFKPVDVVQTIGTSTTTVMSQKASTDNFAKQISNESYRFGYVAIRNTTATLALFRESDQSRIDIEFSDTNANLALIYRNPRGMATSRVEITPNGNIIGDVWRI